MADRRRRALDVRAESYGCAISSGAAGPYRSLLLVRLLGCSRDDRRDSVQLRGRIRRRVAANLAVPAGRPWTRTSPLRWSRGRMGLVDVGEGAPFLHDETERAVLCSSISRMQRRSRCASRRATTGTGVRSGLAPSPERERAARARALGDYLPWVPDDTLADDIPEPTSFRWLLAVNETWTFPKEPDGRGRVNRQASSSSTVSSSKISRRPASHASGARFCTNGSSRASPSASSFSSAMAAAHVFPA